MHTFLKTLRDKPIEVRKRIALITSTTLSVMIAFIGWTSINQNPSVNEPEVKAPTPMTVIKANAKDATHKLIGMWFDVTGQMQALSQSEISGQAAAAALADSSSTIAVMNASSSVPLIEEEGDHRTEDSPITSVSTTTAN